MTTNANHDHRLGLVRFAATGAVTGALLIVLCWIATFLPVSSPTHAYIALFTPAETQSVTALVEGGLWSLLFGAVAGGLLAWVYNRFAGLDRHG